MTERKEFSEMTLAELDEFIDTTQRRIKEILTRDKAELIKATAWRSERVSELSPEERTVRRKERYRSSGRLAWLERSLS